jgi:antitoxin component YwqK of YwqJK toxin-antitoxin module|tara:strand:+ start:223 stop:582 length:360 start_codon:yes stop_codon:yes gene_type:complete
MIKIIILFIFFPLISLGNQSTIMTEKELKVCSSYFSNGNQEFTGTYLDDYKDGKYHEWREGEWKFWYPDGQIRFTGFYKSGQLVSENCWRSSGEVIDCELLSLSEQEKQRLFKKILINK